MVTETLLEAVDRIILGSGSQFYRPAGGPTVKHRPDPPEFGGQHTWNETAERWEPITAERLETALRETANELELVWSNMGQRRANRFVEQARKLLGE